MDKTGRLDQARMYPVPPIQFVQQVLVPETAARLIQEDMHLSYEEALQIMQDSSAYGKAIHSEIIFSSDDDDDSS